MAIIIATELITGGNVSIRLINRITEIIASIKSAHDSTLIKETSSLLIAHKKPGNSNKAIAITNIFDNTSSPLLITEIIRRLEATITTVHK